MLLPHVAELDVSRALDKVVEQTLCCAGIGEPPVDAWTVATALSISVSLDDRQSGRARIARFRFDDRDAGVTAIYIRSDPRPQRMQWAIAHEIGEELAWQVFERIGESANGENGAVRERVANALAGRLLLPTKWFFADARREGWDLFSVKQLYATASHELIARRMLDAPLPTVITIFDNGARSMRQGNLNRVPPDLSNLERRCLDEVRGNSAPIDREDEAMRVQAWPVYEPEWKREILRTELLGIEEW